MTNQTAIDIRPCEIQNIYNLLTMIFESKYKPLELPKVSVPEFIIAQGNERADEPVFIPSHTTTRAEANPLSTNDIRNNATALANALLAQDAEGGPWKKSEVMLLYSENQHDFLQVALGVLQAGGIAALLNPQYKTDEVAHVIKQVSPRGLIASNATLSTAKSALEKLDISIPLHIYEEHVEHSYHNLLAKGHRLLRNGAREHEKVTINPDSDTAIYCFSSGTSGMPKVVCLSHTNIVSNIIQSTVMLGGRVNKPVFDPSSWYDQPIGVPQDGKNELHVSILPQFHCYGLIMTLVSLHTVTPNVIFSRFSPEHILQSIERHRATFMFVVPPIVLALATMYTDQYDVSSIKSLASGAATLTKDLRQLLFERKGIRVTDGYGMTEMSPIISMQTVADLDRSQNPNVGRLVPNTIARVVDVETGKDVSPGKIGELWLRGPQMMLGYLKNEEATKKAFSDDEPHFLKTGDIVSIDNDGMYNLTQGILLFVTDSRT